MPAIHAVGIDLGTTYSCIAHLNEQGEPISIPNREGEISTPSVVMIDRGEEIVGTEALRNAIMHPSQVVQNAKRYMGDPNKKWTIEGQVYTPVDISAAILKKLLHDARQQIGPIERAVITVPAQFSDAQRLATVDAGKRAGLKQVDIINEPVAAALCYVLGTEGLWFTELAAEQRILVYDLGGGTFDLSLVSYKKDQVKVIASTGDLHLGGIDWNQCLLTAIADQFTREFDEDPRSDPESLQHLAWEVEQCKRSLTVRPKAALICQHAGRRKTYQVEREQFNRLTQHLVKRTDEITRQLIEQHRKGASHLDLTVLSTGGSSRMPMIDDMLKELKGTTISKALSPDQSIAHGATYYAGMLLTNSEFVHSILGEEATARLAKMRQQSVNARALGILIRDVKANVREPYYILPANTPLPASVTKTFGTVVPNQKRVNLHIIESGVGSEAKFVELGNCTIDQLPPHLPAESKIAVTISYDDSARVKVSARDLTSGKEARTEIHRGENILAPGEQDDDDDAIPLMAVEDEPLAAPVAEPPKPRPSPTLTAPPAAAKPAPVKPAPAPVAASRPAAAPQKPASVKPVAVKPAVRPVPSGVAPVPTAKKPDPLDIRDLPKKKPAPPAGKRPAKPGSPDDTDAGEEEFWKLSEKK